MKKRIMSVLLCLVMAVSLCSVAMAIPPQITSVDLSLNGYQDGALASRTTISIDSMGPAGSLELDGTNTYGGAFKIYRTHTETNESCTLSNPLQANDTFAKDTDYWLEVKVKVTGDYDIGSDTAFYLSNHGHGAASPEHCVRSNPGDSSSNYMTHATLVFKLDQLKQIDIPFTKVVELGGSKNASRETFNLEEVQRDEGAQYTVSGWVVTNGEGTYADGKIVISGTVSALGNLAEGIQVKEIVPTNAAGWTYDNTVWTIKVASITSGNESGNINGELTGSNGNQFAVVPSGNSYTWEVFKGEETEPSENIAFTNTYTAYRTTHRNPTPTEKIEAPKTFDAGIAVYGVMAVSSLLGMGYMGKKKF